MKPCSPHQLFHVKTYKGISCLVNVLYNFVPVCRYNLDPLGKHPDEEIWTALERAHLKDMVSELNPGGLLCLSGRDDRRAILKMTPKMYT